MMIFETIAWVFFLMVIFDIAFDGERWRRKQRIRAKAHKLGKIRVL